MTVEFMPTIASSTNYGIARRFLALVTTVWLVFGFAVWTLRADEPLDIPNRPAFPKSDPNEIDRMQRKQEAVMPLQRLEKARPVPLDINAAARQRDWVESWIFSGLSAENARKQLEDAAEFRFGILRSKAGVDESQMRRIELAAKGDIVRFFRRVDELKDKYKESQPDRNNVQELGQAISPIQQLWNKGLAGSESLFVGVVNSTLTEAQKGLLTRERETKLHERRTFHARNFVRSVERTVPLSSSQRDKLIELVVQSMSTEPVHASFEMFVPIQAAATFEPEDLSPFMDKSQIEAFSKLQVHWRANIPKPQFGKEVPLTNSQEDWLDGIR